MEEIKCEMLNYEQAAKLLGIGLNTLRRMVARGVVQPIRLGPRRIGFPESELRAQFRLR